MSEIKQTPANKTKEFYQDFADTIATMIEQGTAPWQKPWKAGEFQLPYNPTSKKIYNGVNLLNLLSTGYNDPRFLTFNQLRKQDENYHLRKGEKGHKVVYYEFTKKEPVLDENKNPVFDEEGNAQTKTFSREFPIIKFFTVFNATQIDGIEPLIKKEITWDANERAEQLIKNSQALIVHDKRDRACFYPQTGKISMPDKSQFPSAENYYSTLLHELSHWTKFEEQVPRQISEDMDTKTKYAMEELRAEIATWRICTEIGLPFEPEQSVSYIEGWATATKAMRGDPYVLARACKDAEMIVSHLLSFDSMKIEHTHKKEEKQNVIEKSALYKTFANSIADMIEKTNDSIIKSNANGDSSGDLENLDIADEFFVKNLLVHFDMTQKNTVYQLIEHNQNKERNISTKFMKNLDNEHHHEFLTEIQKIEYYEGDFAGAGAFSAPEERLSWVLAKNFEAEGNPRDNGKHLSEILAQFRLSSELEIPFKLTNFGQFHSDYAEYLRNLDTVELEKVCLNAEKIIANVISHYLPEQEINLHKKHTFYFEIPKGEQEELAKDLGCKWDNDSKLWYAINTSPHLDYILTSWVEKEYPLRFELNVPNHDEEQAEKFGAMFDSDMYEYCVFDNNPNISQILESWGTEAQRKRFAQKENELLPSKNLLQENQKLFVPYHERNNAKKLGAKWDVEQKSWYAPKGTELEKFSKWLKPQEKTPLSTLTAQEEFAKVLKEAGLVLDQAPIMDGQIHRVAVEKDNMRNLDGAYKGHLDGIPAGFYQNFSTGETSNWKYSGQEFSLEAKIQYKEIAIEQKEKVEELRKQEQGQAAKKAYGIWMNAPSWANEHTYLQKKEVKGYGIKINESGNLLVPIRDKEGRIQSMQFISPEGEKFLLKNGKLAGGFHSIDPNKELGQSPIIVTEGYATAATLHEVSGQPTVCCFSSSNLLNVVQALREKFPTQEIQIMADNDHKNEVNVGIKKAYEVATKIENVKVFAPKFTEEDKAKSLTDFNDLAKSKGCNVVLEQLKEQNIAHKVKNTAYKAQDNAMAM